MALIACVLWLAGFEVLPWLHVATHEHIGKHHHDAGGAIVLDGADDESVHVAHEDEDAEVDEHGSRVAHVADHDDEDADVDEHGAPVAHHAHHADHERKPRNDGETRLRNSLGHGRHSLAHHDVSTTSPPPVITQPLPVERRPIFLFSDTAIEPYSLSPGRAVARGPPVLVLES